MSVRCYYTMVLPSRSYTPHVVLPFGDGMMRVVVVMVVVVVVVMVVGDDGDVAGAYLAHFMGRFFQCSSGPPSQINMLYSNESIY